MQVLVGADGSTYARLAEELIQRIPEWRSAEVIVASVAPPVDFGIGAIAPGAGAIYAEQAAKAYEDGRRAARDEADAAVTRLNLAGMKATAAYLEGDPGSELLEFAERNAVGAIAIGSRGLGAIQSALLGSVARKLVSHAPCHVLIARASKGKSPEETLAALDSMPKLVATLGVDGSKGAEVLLEFVKRQGPQSFEKLFAVCAEPLSVVPSGIDPGMFVDLYKYDHERAEETAARAAERLHGCAESAVQAETGLGRPSTVIGQKAAAHDSDLIMVSATRHGTLERFLIGSVSYELATEAPCSVLVIRPMAA